MGLRGIEGGDKFWRKWVSIYPKAEMGLRVCCRKWFLASIFGVSIYPKAEMGLRVYFRN